MAVFHGEKGAGRPLPILSPSVNAVFRDLHDHHPRSVAGKFSQWPPVPSNLDIGIWAAPHTASGCEPQGPLHPRLDVMQCFFGRWCVVKGWGLDKAHQHEASRLSQICIPVRYQSI